MKLLFIHGFGLTTQIWKYAPEYLEKIPFSVLALPGYPLGQDVSFETIDDYGKWLNNYVTTPTILVCHSMAGYIALESIQYRNKNIYGLALVHSHPFADSDPKKEQRKKTALFIKNNGSLAFVKSFIPNLFYNKNNEAINTLILSSEKINFSCLAKNSIAMSNRLDHSNTIETMNLPLSFIFGKHDGLFDYHDILKFASLSSTKQMSMMKSSAHMSMIEDPQAFYDEIISFYYVCLNLT